MFSLLRRYPLTAFVFLAYGFSWLCWIPILDQIQTNPFKSAPNVLLRMLLGGYAPTLAALSMAAVIGGRRGVGDLLRRFKIWRVGASTYAIALLWSPVVVAISTLVYVALGGEIGYVHLPALLWVPVMFLAVIIFGPLAEELGWRGFALPRLLERYGAVRSSLTIGAIWTFWHAPLFWAAAGTSISGEPVTLLAITTYAVSVTGSCFVFTWLFQRSKGSVLICVLTHLSVNGTSVVVSYLMPELGPETTYHIWSIGAAVIGLATIGFIAFGRHSPIRATKGISA